MMNIEQIIKGFERTHCTLDLRRHADGTYIVDAVADKFSSYRAGFFDGSTSIQKASQEEVKHAYENNLVDMLGMDYVFDSTSTYKEHLKEALFRCFLFGFREAEKNHIVLEKKLGESHAN